MEVNQEQEFAVVTKGAGGQGHLEVTLVIVAFLYLLHFSVGGGASHFLPLCALLVES